MRGSHFISYHAAGHLCCAHARTPRNSEQSWNTSRSGKGDRCWVEGVGGVITRIEEFIYCRKRALRSMEPESMRSEKQVDQAVKRAPLFCWMIWRCTASLCCLLGFHFMRFRWIPGSRVCKWNHSCFDSSQLIKTRVERINITVNKTGGLAWQQKSYWHQCVREQSERNVRLLKYREQQWPESLKSNYSNKWAAVMKMAAVFKSI